MQIQLSSTNWKMHIIRGFGIQIQNLQTEITRSIFEQNLKSEKNFPVNQLEKLTSSPITTLSLV